MTPLGATASSSWTNPCGGAGWLELPDGSYEVEGLGVPLYEPGHARHEIVVGTWDNWGCLLAEAAARHGVPTSWLLAIASVETGPWWQRREEQSQAVSYAGAMGIMQIMPSTAELLGYAPEEMFDPRKNIDAGALAVERISRGVKSGLPAICGAYNSGKVCCDDPRGCRPGCENIYRVCTDGDYPGAAIRYNNTAVAYLDLSPCRGVGLMGMATAGLFGVGAWGLYRWWQSR